MRKLYLGLLILLIPFFISAQNGTGNLSIIPQPVSVIQNTGRYMFPRNIAIEINNQEPGTEEVGKMLIDRLAPATGYKINLKKVKVFSKNAIRLVIAKQELKSLTNEGYRLSVTTGGITITAAAPAGLFYGTQTLMQLFPPEIESKTKVVKPVWSLPLVQIMDYPRFTWRGLMLDEARHFFNKDQVKQFIDDMAKYKFNLLHLHLTDDDGWRIEIKSLPKLTEVGAWRVNKVGFYGFFSPPTPDEPKTYGGFLSQDDIRELVQYASRRFINIMPEIDVPGHSLAAIAAYSDLNSTPGNYTPCAGEKIMEWPKDAHFYALVDNSLCPAKEEVYDFLDKVFTEVAQLFPFEYIHVGGDENAKNFWEKSELIKQLMGKENLKDLSAVQNYFTHRVAKIVESKGKKMMGWDEIMEGELSPGAAVMSWQGTKGGIEAARLKHEVVFSPKSYAYLNYMQGDAAIEPPVHSTRLLKTVYETEPLPEGVDAKYVKGIQGNLWTEQVFNYRQLQYQLWPRAFAIAELSWGATGRKNWADFIRRIENHFTRYDFSETKYCPSIYDPVFKVVMASDSSIKVRMETQITGLDLHYSFDNSFPDGKYPVCKETVDVPKDASLLKVISYRDGKPIGRMISISIADLRKRI